MRPFVEDLSRAADTYVACYPNAGLPNAMGEHDEQPGDTSRYLRAFAEDGLVNVVGGCCGTEAGAHPPDRRQRRGHPHADDPGARCGGRAGAASSRSSSGRTPVS